MKHNSRGIQALLILKETATYKHLPYSISTFHEPENKIGNCLFYRFDARYVSLYKERSFIKSFSQSILFM